MKTLALVVFLLASGVAHGAYAGSCDAIVGKWAWFTKGVVTIKSDGTMVHEPGNDGTWKCTDASRGIVTLKWRVGGYVNTMVLSPDGRGMSSTDPSQSFVAAKKMDAGASSVSSRTPTPDAPAPNTPVPNTPVSGASASVTPPLPPASVPPAGAPPAAASAAALSQAYNSFQEGRRLAASGRCREAIPYFNQAIQANPNDAKAYSDRGRCQAMLGQLSQGLKDLDRAVQIAPNNMSPYFNRAGLRADAGDGDEALADLDLSIRLDPMNPAPRAARSGLLEVAGRAHEAQLDADTAYRQVDTLASKKRPIVDQVLRTWRAKRVRISTFAPSQGGNPIEAAGAAIKAGRDRAALAVLDAALLKHPGDEALLTFRGRLHRDIGQAAQAVEDLTAVLQRRPTAQIFLDRGLAYRQLCRFRDEIDDYDQAVRQDRSVRARLLRARLHDDELPQGKRSSPGPDQGDRTRSPELVGLLPSRPGVWLLAEQAPPRHGRLPAGRGAQARLRPSPSQYGFRAARRRRMNEVDGWLQKCYALDPSEREVTKRVFAKIKTGEEDTARDMAAMRMWYIWRCERAGGMMYYGSCSFPY